MVAEVDIVAVALAPMVVAADIVAVGVTVTGGSPDLIMLSSLQPLPSPSLKASLCNRANLPAHATDRDTMLV